mmetsp:Transcript_59121/g.131763  ORF Transcript_59121/g.131763 Transcript_59121/m.131763 type:complete len:276 (-) Transcript_59121:176-1003(-)
MTWLCGKLIWSRRGCWEALKSEEVVRSSQVGPFQMHAALKLFRLCHVRGGKLSPPCLQKDYVAKLRNKTSSELALMQGCVRGGGALAVATDWESCLGLRAATGPKQVRKALEDGSFVWRSMYAVHLRGWLQLYPPSQLSVVDSSQLFSTAGSVRAASMRRLLGASALRLDEAAMRDDVLHGQGPHENQREYIVPRDKLPAEITQRITEWLRPYNCQLAILLSQHRMAGDALQDLPWLSADLCSTGWARTGCPWVWQWQCSRGEHEHVSQRRSRTR